MSNFLFSQIFAGLAIISDLLSFQFKQRRLILVGLIFSAIFMAIHYFLLEKNMAGLLILISSIRFTSAYFYPNKYLIYLFVSLNTFIFFYFYKTPIDTVAYIGITLATIASFQKKDKLLRTIMMTATTCFICYNLLINSPAGASVEGIFLLSNFVGYYRHYLRK